MTTPASSSLVLRNSTGTTVELWFYARSGAGGQLIGSRAASLPGWSVRYSSRLVYFEGGTLTGAYFQIVTSAPLAENTWHHVAFVRSSAFSGVWRAYVDGVESSGTRTEVGGGATGDFRSDYAITAGAFPGYVNQQFSGMFGSFMVSNGARYSSSFTPEPVLVPDASTLSHWALDEGSGSTSADGVGGRTMTLSGATWSSGGPDCP